MVVHSVFLQLSKSVQASCLETIRKLYLENSHLMRVDLNLAFAVRVLSLSQTPENEDILQRIYRERPSNMVRRYIILTMANWGAAYWLTDKLNGFSSMVGGERRALLIASFSLTDEGRHWRGYNDRWFAPFEAIIRKWMEKKSQLPNWRIPV